MSIKSSIHDLRLKAKFKRLSIGKRYNRFVNKTFVEEGIKLLAKAEAHLQKIDDKQDKANEIFDQERSRIIAEQEQKQAALKAALESIPVETSSRIDRVDTLANI